MPANPEPPVFIIGSPRSGTTMLVRLMNRFLDIHVSRDAGVFVRFARMLPRYGDLGQVRNMRRLVDDLYRDHEFRVRLLGRGLETSAADLVDGLEELTYRALVDRTFSEVARHQGKTRWGNKRPSYALNVAELDGLFPAARFVHIVRDGRDVVLSMRAAVNQMFDRNWYCAARDWRVHVEAGRRLGAPLGGSRYLEIRYEDLLSNPVPVFERIVEFIGPSLRNRQGLEQFGHEAGTLLKQGNFGKWRRVMPSSAVRIVEEAAGDLLADLGYEVVNRDVAGRQPASWRRGCYTLDNLRRKICSPAILSYVQTASHRLVTRGRAAFGGSEAGR